MTNLMLAPGWLGFPGAPPEVREQLRQQIPPQVPAGYLELLALTDGGEGPLPVRPYRCYLDDAARVLAGLAQTWRADWLGQGFLVIGGDGGGELIAFDLRAAGEPPVVTVDLVAGAESAMEVAASFEAFTALLGRQA